MIKKFLFLLLALNVLTVKAELNYQAYYKMDNADPNNMKWYDNSAKLHFLDSNYIIIEDNFGLYALQIFENKQLSDNTFKLRCYDIEGVRNDVIIECIGGYVYITIYLTDKIYIKYKTKQV